MIYICYTYSMEFEWHETKARINAKKHGVAFEEAITCFYDPEHAMMKVVKL